MQRTRPPPDPATDDDRAVRDRPDRSRGLTRPDPASTAAVRTDPASTAAVLVATLLIAGCLVLGAGFVAVTPVTAADDVGTPTVTPDAAEAGATANHEVGFEATDVSDGATITLTLPTSFGDDADGRIHGIDGDDIFVDNGILDGDPVVDDETVTVDVDVDGGAVDIDVLVSLDLTHPWAAGDHDITVDVESEDGTSTSTTANAAFATTEAASYLVDGEPRTTVFDGQSVTVAGLEPGASYTLRRGNADESSPVVGETAGGDGTFTVDTTGLDVDASYFLEDVDDPAAGDGFELVEHELSVSIGDETVVDAGPGAETSFAVGSALRTEPYPVDVSAGGSLSAEELFTVLTGGESPDGVPRDADPDDPDSATTTVGPSGFAVGLYDKGVDGADERVVLVDGGERSGTVTFAGTTRTTYELEATALDTGASDTTTVSVEEAELDGSFGRDVYTSPAGDLVEITADLGEANEGFIVVGGDRLSDPDVPAGYLDVLYVEGTPTITVNTRLIGTDADSDEVYAGEGTVVSYAHEYGPDTPAADTTTFADLAFVDADGEHVADDLATFRPAADAGGIVGPLVPGRYRLTVGTGESIVVRDDGVVEPERSFARSHLVLTEPGFREDIEVFTATSGSASGAESVDDLRENGLERPNVTEDDRVVLGFEATGIWGALTHRAGEAAIYEDGESSVVPLESLLDVDEGVSLSVRQTNPGRNERRTELDLADASPGDAYLLFDAPSDVGTGDGSDVLGGELGDGPIAGAFYLVIDTRGGAFTDDLSPGDEFEVEFALEGDAGERYRFDRSASGPPPAFAPESASDDGLNEQFPYWLYDDDGVSTNASFRIVAERYEYDRTTADGDVLVAPDDGTIPGTTTLLPATDLEAEFVSDAGTTPTVASNDVDIDDDGTFAIDANFSGAEPGQRVTMEVYESGSLYESRAVLVVGDPDNPFTFAIDEAAETVRVTEGETLENLTATVRNEGDIDGVDRLSLDVDDGRLTDDERVRLRTTRAENVSFSSTVADLDPGEYSFTLSTDDDEHVGKLVIEPSDERESVEADQTDPDDADDDGPADQVGDGEEESERSDNDTDSADAEDGSVSPDDGPDDDPAAVPLPLGVGTREALGGTAVVGGAYLLGHWV